MRPALWLVRLHGEFPGWMVAHVPADEGTRPAGWYARWPAYGDLAYAETPGGLRRKMASAESRRYGSRYGGGR